MSERDRYESMSTGPGQLELDIIDILYSLAGSNLRSPYTAPTALTQQDVLLLDDIGFVLTLPGMSEQAHAYLRDTLAKLTARHVRSTSQ